MKISAQNITPKTVINRHGEHLEVESVEDKYDRAGNLRIRIKAGGFYFMSNPLDMVEVVRTDITGDPKLQTTPSRVQGVSGEVP